GTGFGARTLTAPGAYNDGRWHHIVLLREGGTFSMRIDGEEVATGTAPRGSVTEGKEFGVDGLSVGQRIDGANRFAGSLDEVRVYRRALSEKELDRLERSNAAIRDGLALRLAFEQIR
ncbi:MAG TPA: LamG domain-containing protein, partial [Actinopolymorphaceae bacterium]